jgi:cell division protein FtsA
MDDARILTAIDVGTTKVCTIIGKLTGSNDLEILAYSVIPSEGLKKGNVADVAAAEKAIRASIQEAGQRAGITVRSAYVGVAGAHVAFEDRQDTVAGVGNRGVITAQDVKRVPAMVAASKIEAGREIIHAIPISYSLDGQRGISNPLGMHSENLEVETHLVTGAIPVVAKLVSAVEGAGVKVDALVLEPLASGEAVLTSEEKRKGAVLVDIGGGTTDVVVFKKNRIHFTAVLPVGGYQFSNDICLTYNTPYAAAEAAKLAYAHTEPSTVRPEEEISLPVTGRTTELKILRRDLCQLTRERALELINLIRMKLVEANIVDMAGVRLVLTGGTSNLPGLHDLVRRNLTHRARIGAPDGNRNIPEALKVPSHSTGVGILLWARNQQNPFGAQSMNGDGAHTSEVVEGLVFRLIERIKKLLPVNLFSATQGRS